jgi:tRNA-(ms[2]io[6]A)-hydroxylase
MVADALEEPSLKRFYKTLWASEAKHGHTFVKMALNYFPKDDVYKRLEWWVDQEQEVIDGLEIRAALH